MADQPEKIWHRVRFRKQDNPIELRCRNCNFQMYGRYCHVCGQDLFAGRTSGPRNIAYNFLDSIYAVDTKIFDTLKLLLFYPGRLSLEYYRGRIIRYVHPSKLFWFISIVFFLFISYRFDADSGNEAKEKAKTEKQLTKTETSNDAIAGNKPSEKTPGKNNSSEKTTKVQAAKTDMIHHSADSAKVTQKNPKAKQNDSFTDGILKGTSKDKFISTFWAYAPYATLMLIPFFSFLMFIFFRKYMRKYSYHMIFALHFHAFVYLFIGISALVSDFWPSILSGYLIFIPFIYLFIAVYNFYKPRMIPAFFKLVIIAIIYFFMMIFVLVIFIIFVAYKASGENLTRFLIDI